MSTLDFNIDQDEKPELTDRLLDYYFQIKLKGKTDDEIRASLKQKNYDESVVSLAINLLNKRHNKLLMATKRKAQAKLLVWMGSSFLISGLVLIYMSYIQQISEHFLFGFYVFTAFGFLGLVTGLIVHNNMRKIK